MVKNVCTTCSPAGPLGGASLKRTRAAYVPSKNLRWAVESSVWTVPPGVPSVRESIVSRPFGNVIADGDQVAPGTPGPPELERTVQPRWARRGSAEFVYEKSSKSTPPGPGGGSVGVGVGPGSSPDGVPQASSPPI